MQPIADIRRDYKLQQLLETDAAQNPFDQFAHWWQQALDAQIDEVNAMTLCTVDDAGQPQGRIVLLKDYDADGFVFFTNYNSHKGQQLLHNPKAALVFFWKELERQVRISGTVQPIEAAQSDAYFASRPPGSRLGAWASPQSSPINGREPLEQNLAALVAQHPNGDVQRPPHWGGYCLAPTQIEFWQGRPSRLHDRLLYTKTEQQWRIQRLAP
ncbi:MAG: pyridoxamine 5'-phosphate oxidase [Bacteroidetes bacterium]|nr:MAG: pyridoxamine 5'-phosphate oxidase [Bacteroidota bacterium]